MPEDNSRSGAWFVLLAAMLWGTTGTAQAFAPSGFDPMVIGTLRLALGGCAMLLVLMLQSGLSQLRGWPLKATVVAAVFTALYQVCFFAGVAKTGVAVAGWSISEIPKQPAILLSNADQRIIFIAGNQVITKQGLEVLALFNDRLYQDGQDTQTVIDKINENNGLPVLPWGVGKWLGKRGNIITDLLNANSPERLAIADISARPALWPLPEQFKLSYKSGFSCLFGTDPLPIKYDQSRIASAGMVMDLSSDPTLALSELKSSLLKQSENNTFGNRVSTFQFVKDQLMLRLNKPSCLSAQ